MPQLVNAIRYLPKTDLLKLASTVGAYLPPSLVEIIQVLVYVFPVLCAQCSLLFQSGPATVHGLNILLLHDNVILSVLKVGQQSN